MQASKDAAPKERRKAARARLAAWLLCFTALCASIVPGCGGACPDGESRPLLRRSTSGVQTIEGTEACFDGEWRKHGLFVFRDPDTGDVIAEGAYDRGLEHGAWTQTLKGGVKGQGEFREGKRNGPWTYSYSNGKLQERGSYERGKRTGRWLSHRFDGSLWRDASYSDGALEGEVRVYTAEGTLDPGASGVFADGKRVGPLTP